MKKSRFIARSAIVAALYVVTTMLCYPFAYGMIQFRLSEIMTLLAWFEPLYIPGLLVGCFFANLFGIGGLTDAIFGTVASIVAFLWMLAFRPVKNKRLSLYLAGLGPAVSGVVIAAEMRFALGDSTGFWIWFFYVALGEFVVVELIGCPLAAYLGKKEKARRLIHNIKEE